MSCFAIFSSICFAQNNTTNSAQTNSKLTTETAEERINFLLQVGSAYFSEKDFESAVSAYERVLEIDPNHQEALFILGHISISAKQYEKAEALIKKQIKNDPDNFKLFNNLAWLYATAEDPAFRDGKKAIKYAQEAMALAMALAPNDHHVWSTLSEAYYVSGEYEKAYEAIVHMANVASRHGSGLTKEAVDSYNEQIRKCKRAWDTEKVINESIDQ
jgi:tetratricopeptide (TPR) repeat protein